MIRKLLCRLGFHKYQYDCVLPRIKDHLKRNFLSSRCHLNCWHCEAHKKVCEYCGKVKQDD